MLLYALTVLIGALLLFLVQPMIAKIILPWFGGAAGVWTTCLLFFQVALLLGYGYAWALVRYLTPRAQRWFHAVLLLSSLAILPIAPDAAWKPGPGDGPTWRILLLLGATIGLPYFLLSTTGPLLQAWYSREHARAMPYRLYALSNLGSLLALVSYPTLVEPFLATGTQARGWSVAYGAFVLVCGVVAFRGLRGQMAGSAASDAGPAAPTPPSLLLLWMGLAACASALLLSITGHVSQNVAPIPFLWIVPLGVYLMTFILCFEHEGWYQRGWFLGPLVLALAVLALAMGKENDGSVLIIVPMYVAGLFITCMVCHGELARLKPEPRRLTVFYMMIASGGALGGVFVGLVAPAWFDGFYELPVAMIGCALLVLIVLYRDPQSALHRGRPRTAWIGLITLTVVLIGVLVVLKSETDGEVRTRSRNFYGGVEVVDYGSADEIERVLTHGTVIHGAQFPNDPKLRSRPTTYYGASTGVGISILDRLPDAPQRVGVIGLGVGTTAAFGRAGDTHRFYEINPQVIEIARSWFSYLSDSAAAVEIVLGDARLSLENEPDQAFDVLAVDAFSSDAIPVHLLTLEAFELYFRHLDEDGILAVHVSNHHLDLQPVVSRAVEMLGRKGYLIDSDELPDEGQYASSWILVGNHPDRLESFMDHGYGEPVAPAAAFRIWTDDYSNLLRILR